MLEWSALLVLISAVFTLMFALGIPGRVARTVVCAIGQIVRAEVCTSGPAYPVTVSTKTVGDQARVVIVDGGHQYVVTMTKMSNGTAQISLVNTGQLGLSARIGGDVDLGPLGSAEAQAQAGGGVYANGSTTWTFPNWQTAENYWRQVSSGNSGGLVVNDTVGSLPVVGHSLSGFIDHVTGAKGEPTIHSISRRYLSATAIGGGAQGTASAGAGLDAGPIDAEIKASISAQAVLEHINSGSQKGDWQGSVQLSVDGDGSLGEALFGSHAGAEGSLDGEATVTFSPGGTPEELEVTATGEGVWEAAGPSSGVPDGSVNIPGSSGSGGGDSGGGGDSSGGSDSGGGDSEGGGDSGGGEKGEESEPLLAVSHDSTGGQGVGSTFVGTLDLSDNPTAQAALAQVLGGNTIGIPTLVSQMNANGSEYIQTFHLTKSSSAWGGQFNVGGGLGAQVSDGSSSACYDPPKVRQGEGPWTTASFNGAPAC